MVEVYGHIVRTRGIVDESEPLDDVALDGVGQIVHGVGAVGEAEVDDGRGVRVVRLIAPEEIGGVQVVVGPERGECGEKRRKLGVKGREEVEGLRGADANSRMASERWAEAKIARHGRDRIARGKDGKTGDQRAGLAGRSSEVACG